MRSRPCHCISSSIPLRFRELWQGSKLRVAPLSQSARTTRAYSLSVSRPVRSMDELLAKGRVSRPVLEALDRSLSGYELSVSDAEVLLQATGPDLNALTAAADEVRRQWVGGEVTYVVNRNINFTNVCIKRCGFCAFSRTGVDQEGYFLPEDEIVRRASEAARMGASEVCIQAGLPPNMDAGLYARLCRAIKDKHPQMHIHAFSPEEVIYGTKRASTGIRDFLLELQAAGVGSLPGTSAEILDNKLRRSIARGRLSVEQWIEVVTNAHDIGLPTTATMMYGFCESANHIARHLVLVRDLQKRAQAGASACFTEFVPLGFVASEAPMWRQPAPGTPLVRPGPSGEEVLRAHAVARLVLHPGLPGGFRNIQASWVKEGLKLAQLLLGVGANDLGGTLINESISTAAGAAHGQLAKPSQLRRLVWQLGSERSVAERSTTYSKRLRVFDQPDGYEGEALERAEELAQRHRTQSQHAKGDTAGEDTLENIRDPEHSFGSFHKLVGESQFRFRDQRDGASRGGTKRHGISVMTKQSSSMRGTPPLASSEAGGSSRTVYTLTGDPRLKRASPLQGAVTTWSRFASTTRKKQRAVTYSPSYTVVPSYECFNICTYCNFRRDVTKHGDDWLQLPEARMRLQALEPSSVVEVLVMSGEVHPRASNRQAWLERIEAICGLALEYGFLPHTNVGPLSEDEMGRLAAVNASMGLMLEQISPALQAFDGVHRLAPSKNPQTRLEQLRQAGRLRIPFTTGLLVGIGETPQERIDALEAIACIASEGGHIQEVILQPHSLGSSQRLIPNKAVVHRDEIRRPLFGADAVTALPGLVRAARERLPKDVVVQVPPNLVLHGCGASANIVPSSPPWKHSLGWELLLACLEAGASDLGGISPKDEVNPDFTFPTIPDLGAALAEEGYALEPRLPLYSRHFEWVPQRVAPALARRLQTSGLRFGPTAFADATSTSCAAHGPEAALR